VFGDELGRPHGTIKTAWRLLCGRAKITDLHFHDLRREAGSRWMDAGVPLGTIQRWLGHSNISQTSKYLAAALGRDIDEMRAYEERIGRLPSPEPNMIETGEQEVGPNPEPHTDTIVH
jgi:integrase